MDNLTVKSAQVLCEALEIYSDYFDEDNEECVMLKENNLDLFNAYVELFELANKS